MDLHPHEVAHAMAYTEYNLFVNIKLTEFLERSWQTDTANSLIYVMVNRYSPYRHPLYFLLLHLEMN